MLVTVLVSVSIAISICIWGLLLSACSLRADFLVGGSRASCPLGIPPPEWQSRCHTGRMRDGAIKGYYE